MSLNARNKGASGEREAAKWLKGLLKLDYTPERNLEQVRDGGYDLYVHPFIVEVKRCETLLLKQWWRQVKHASAMLEGIPVVLFRQNRQPWRLLISAEYIGLKSGYVQLDANETKEWLKWMYSNT